MSVTLVSASGSTLVVRVPFQPSDSRACALALKIARAEHGERGWIAREVL